MTTAEADHECSFPVNPPGGSFTNPGACECGKTYARSEAERALTAIARAMSETEPGGGVTAGRRACEAFWTAMGAGPDGQPADAAWERAGGRQARGAWEAAAAVANAPLEAEITRLRAALEALADPEPMEFVIEYEPTPVRNELAARVDFAKRALDGGPAGGVPVAGAAFLGDRDRDLEEIRGYVAARAGSYVTVAGVRRNAGVVGLGRVTVLLGRLARAGEVIGPDDRGRYTVPR